MISELPKFIFLSIETFDQETPQISKVYEVETGPPKIRPLQNLDNTTSQVQVFIEANKYKDFMEWWKNDLDFGSQLLRLPHPLTGEDSVFRIENESFVFSSVRQNILSTTLSLREFYDN